MVPKRVVSLGLIVLAMPVVAQESLDVILNRGYVAQWLVCGPFQPDVDGGLVAAVKQGAAPLGQTDFMAPAGGIARLRSQAIKRRPCDRVTSGCGADPKLKIPLFRAVSVAPLREPILLRLPGRASILRRPQK